MRTSLFSSHLKLEAKMTPFAGFEMPLFYESVLKEHQAVREKVGVFDLSHMGLIEITGVEAEKFLDYMTVSHVVGSKEGSSHYTLFCNSIGGVIDDVIYYRLGAERFFVVVNGANRLKILLHLEKEAIAYKVKVTPLFEEFSILALQGPKSEGFFPEMKPHRIQKIEDMWIATTGYTGEKGYEIYLPNSKVTELFNALLAKGATPCGLGARDTLRLEMGYALYGHELNEERSPLESVSSFVVKMDKEHFFGKEALLKREVELTPVALILDSGICRYEDLIFQNNEEIGTITSGNFSPQLKKGIALGLVKKGSEGPFTVHIRGRPVGVQVVSLPFFRR